MLIKIENGLKNGTEKLMRNSPPVAKLLFVPFIVAGFILYVVTCISLWLIGFYRCNRCEEVQHMFKQPKWEIFHPCPRGLGDTFETVCAACGEKNEKKRAGRSRLTPGVSARNMKYD